MHIIKGGLQRGAVRAGLEEAFPWTVPGVRGELSTVDHKDSLPGRWADILTQPATEGFILALSLLSATGSGTVLT